jgi:hypothetical protein
MMNQAKDYENVIYFPKDIGCTGLAIQSNDMIYFNEGERLPAFNLEVDCSGGSTDVESLLVAPITDSSGNLRGILQMINRFNGEKITAQDVFEIRSLMPALAEILKTVEEVR